MASINASEYFWGLESSLPANGEIYKVWDFLQRRWLIAILSAVIGYVLIAQRRILISNGTPYPFAGYRSWFEPTALVRFRFTFAGTSIVQDAYRKFMSKPNNPFWIRRNDIDVLILPPQCADEIATYRKTEMSGIDALAFNVLGNYNSIDLFAKSDLHLRVLRTYVTANMSQVMANARDELDFAWGQHVPDCTEWKEIKVHDVMLWIIARLSARTFVGYPACRNNEYIRTTIDYTKDVFTLALIVHHFPGWLAPILIPVTPARWRILRHQRYATQVMVPEIKRYEEAVAIGAQDSEPVTLLSGMLKDAKGEEKNLHEIVVRQMVSSLASIHTTTMTTTFCLLELCRNSELLDTLREESITASREDSEWYKNSSFKLPKMDSFICEVTRLHSPGVLIPQRRAKIPVTLSNGIKIPRGAQVAFPADAANHDPAIFENPNKFDGLRNYRRRLAAGVGERDTKWLSTTPAWDYLFFGHGSQACPGRFFAINEIKLILSRFLVEFDINEPAWQQKKDLHFGFEDYQLPRLGLKMNIKRREDFLA